MTKLRKGAYHLKSQRTGDDSNTDVLTNKLDYSYSFHFEADPTGAKSRESPNKVREPQEVQKNTIKCSNE